EALIRLQPVTDRELAAAQRAEPHPIRRKLDGAGNAQCSAGPGGGGRSAGGKGAPFTAQTRPPPLTHHIGGGGAFTGALTATSAALADASPPKTALERTVASAAKSFLKSAPLKRKQRNIGVAASLRHFRNRHGKIRAIRAIESSTRPTNRIIVWSNASAGIRRRHPEDNIVRKLSEPRSAGANAPVILYAIAVCCIGMGIVHSTSARAADDDDSDAKPKSAWPTTYLDMRTSYASVPAGSLPIGFGSTALSTALESLALASGNGVPTSLPLASRQGVVMDFPLTVDVSDHVSLYAGASGTATSVSGQGWSSFDITSWNVGFQADVHEQNGGSIPTITWQSTYTQSIPNNTLASTTFTNILEFDYALDE